MAAKPENDTIVAFIRQCYIMFLIKYVSYNLSRQLTTHKTDTANYCQYCKHIQYFIKNMSPLQLPYVRHMYLRRLQFRKYLAKHVTLYGNNSYLFVTIDAV